MSETKEIEVSRGMVQLATNLEGIKKAVDDFTKLKNQLLEEHCMEISGHKYVKKSGWRIVALAFNLSDKIISVEKKDIANGEYIITYTVEVIAPNGRTCQAVGTCSTLEKSASGEKRFHNAETHAHTRAKNRAISDLVGLGELSAEEIDDEPTKCVCAIGKRNWQQGKCQSCGKPVP